MTSTLKLSAWENIVRRTAQPPGWWWLFGLGGIGFAAGFFGPMIFVPESNQGPMVGIFITGPGGGLLGLVLFGLMKFLPVPARAQWILLTAIGLVGTIATLLVVQPEPARLGSIVELKISGMHTPAQAADEVVADWKKRFVSVTWATPRAGWEAEMRRTLAQDQGRVVDVIVVRRRHIMEHRKPWNRGRLFATDWENEPGTHSYYLSADHMASVRQGEAVQFFIANDSLGGVSAPEAWPPHEFERIIGLSILAPVPSAYAEFR